jgi:hypothetical protein
MHSDNPDRKARKGIVTRRWLLGAGGFSLVSLAGCTGDEDDGADNEPDDEPDDEDNPVAAGFTADDDEFADPNWVEIGEIYHAGEEYETDRVEVVNNHEDQPLNIAGWTFETEVMSVTIPDEAVLNPEQTGFVELGDGEDNVLDPDGGVLIVLTDEGELLTEVEYPPAPTETDDADSDTGAGDSDSTDSDDEDTDTDTDNSDAGDPDGDSDADASDDDMGGVDTGDTADSDTGGADAGDTADGGGGDGDQNQNENSDNGDADTGGR